MFHPFEADVMHTPVRAAFGETPRNGLKVSLAWASGPWVSSLEGWSTLPL